MTAIQRLIDRSKRFFRGDIAFRRVILNSGWLFSGNVLTTTLLFVQGIVVARALGVEQYGILTLITTYATTVNQFVDSRVWETVIKFVTQYREQGDFVRAMATVKLAYLIDAITGVVAFLFLFSTASLAAHFFVKDVSTANLIQLYALSILISIPFGTASALLRIANRFDWIAYQSAGEAGLRVIGVLVVATLGYGIQEILSVYLVTRAISIFILVIMQWRSVRGLNLSGWKQAPLSLLKGQIRRILSFTFYSNVGATSRLITSKADILILGWLATPVAVGLYRLAKQLTNIIIMGISPIYTAMYPELSKLVEQGKLSEIQALQRKISLIIATIIFPLSLVFTFTISWIILFAFGEEYLGSVLLAQIMIWQVVWTPLIWLPGWLLALERTRLLASLNWADAGLYLIFLVILILYQGALGAALATLFHFIAWTVMALLIFSRISHNLSYRPSIKTAPLK